MITKICTINVKGATTKHDIDYLGSFAKREGLDIIGIQEVGYSFINKKIEGYKGIINPGKGNRGTAIYYKEGLTVNYTSKHESGRIIKVKIEGMTIVNVYAYPAGGNNTVEVREGFLNRDLITFIGRDTDIIMGDFNASKDREGGGNFSRSLINIVENLGWVDIRENIRPGENTPTFIGHNGHSIIDYFFHTSNIKLHIKDCSNTIYTKSDHRALILSIGGGNKMKNRKNQTEKAVWKLDNRIIEEEGFREEIILLIESLTNTSKKKKTWTQNWEIFKKETKNIANRYLQAKKKEERNYSKHLKNCMEELISLGLKENNLKEYNEVKKELSLHLDRLEHEKCAANKNNFENEKNGLVQEVGEARRKKQRTIERLKTEKEISEEEPEKRKKPTNEEKRMSTQQLDNIIQNYYGKLFKLETKNMEEWDYFLQEIKERLDKKEAEKLTQEFSIDELREAVMRAEKNKAPGIDGITSDFYQSFFKTLGPLMLGYLNDIKIHGLSKNQKIGIISLIHKGGNKENLINYRPIAILCTDYKILTKMIANRVKTVMGGLINKFQSGGIPGRTMTNNSNIARDIITNNEKGALVGLEGIFYTK